MVRCPKCNGVNTKSEGGGFYCNFCFHGWEPDPVADKLYAEWVELDKSDRLVAQIMKPGGRYNVQHVNTEKMMRRSEVARELKANHQHHLDLPPNEWFKIIQDAH